MHLTHILIFKKIETKKFVHTFSRATRLESWFHKISTCHVTCVKKKKIGAKNNAFYKINFLFFTYPVSRDFIIHTIIPVARLAILSFMHATDDLHTRIDCCKEKIYIAGFTI
jgi:hypothetical protein